MWRRRRQTEQSKMKWKKLEVGDKVKSLIVLKGDRAIEVERPKAPKGRILDFPINEDRHRKCKRL